MPVAQNQIKSWVRLDLLWLGLLVLLSGLMIGIRVHYTNTPYYRFLYWNLFLALLPLVFALLACWFRKRKQSYWRSSLFLILWLLFFPNAPYIVTDLMHLGYLNQMPRWYDPLMVFSTAITGLFAGFISLQEIESNMMASLPLWLRHVVVFLICSLSGVGIYLGRVLRWNSWDLLRQPVLIFKDILAPFLNPNDFPSSLGLIFLYAVFLYLLYQFWRASRISVG